MDNWIWFVLIIVGIAVPLAFMAAMNKSVRTDKRQPKGWYDDPKTTGQYRYFDGTKWTDLTAAGDQPPPE